MDSLLFYNQPLFLHLRRERLIWGTLTDFNLKVGNKRNFSKMYYIGQMAAVEERFTEFNYYYERVKENDTLTDRQKEEIIRGFNKLMKVFGESQLREALRNRHPIFDFLRFQAPWSLFYVAELGRKLMMLGEVPNFERLKTMLMNKDEFDSAEAELEIAVKMKKAGFDIELYPTVNSKESDIKVFLDDEEYFFEITTLQASEEERAARKTFYFLTWPFLSDNRISIMGKIHKTLSIPHIHELQRKIRNKITLAIKEDRCLELAEPRVINYLICPKNKVKEQNNWLRRKGLKASLEGPSWYDRIVEPRRIRKRFQDKCKQLPKDRPGIVVIFTSLLYLGGIESNCETLVDILEETIYANSRLICGIIISYYGCVQPEITKLIQKPQYVFSSKYYPKILRKEETVIIKNRYSKFQIDDNSLFQKIFSPFLLS